MNQSRIVYPVLCILLSIALSASLAAAQPATTPQVETNYEVTLHVVIGSTTDAAARGDLPASLSGISRQLRSNFTFTNYRLANTFLGRIANNGNLEYKSVSDIFGQETDTDLRTFLDWNLVGFRAVPNPQSKVNLQAQAFRFGARVPVRTGSTFKDDAGTVRPVINYESIGLTVGRLGLAENTPTLIGTLSLPRATGTLFLVVTIKAADI